MRSATSQSSPLLRVTFLRCIKLLVVLSLLFGAFLFPTWIFADEISRELFDGTVAVKGNVGVEFKGYLEKPETKRDYNLAGIGELETAYHRDGLFGKLLIEGLIDTDDDERNTLRANEAFLQYDFEEQDIRVTLGRQVIFWGALEVNNPVDVVNTRDLVRDPFNTFKMGAYLGAFAKFFENSEIELLVKFYEDEQEFNDKESPYNFFPPFLTYDKNLITEESRTRPTAYLKYSGSTDTFYPLDYAVALSNGYDNQRFITLVGDGLLRQNAYIATKFITFDTLVINATLLKLEASYTDVKDVPFISDYFQLGAGIEHTLEQLYRGWDLGLIAEYYRYDITDDDKFDDLRLFQPFQNDLFLGFRLTFNDVGSSEVVGGGVFDLEYSEEYSLYAKFKTRVFESFVIEADVRKINPTSDEVDTVFKLLGDHTRVSFNIRYFF